MNILFASGRVTPPLFFGGAEVSSRILAYNLIERGYSVTCLGSYSHPKYGTQPRLIDKYVRHLKRLGVKASKTKGIIHYTFRSILCSMVSYETLLQSFCQIIENIQVDLVLTMLEGAPSIVKACKEKGIPSVVWVHDVYPVGLNPLFERPTAVLYTSKFVQERGLMVSDAEGIIFYPPFERIQRQSNKGDRQFITMINPIPEKGGEIFLELARLLPNRKFLAIEGWRRSELFENNNPSNVTYCGKKYDLTSVWQRTRVLLVPSKMEEGFGRVVVEAAQHGIPSIVSARGGLPEAVGEGGLLVSGDSLTEWVCMLKKLDDPDYWAALSVDCKKHAQLFLGNPVSRLVEAGLLERNEN